MQQTEKVALIKYLEYIIQMSVVILQNIFMIS